MTVAVTGGTGFLGDHVLRVLTQAGHRVRALARRPQPDRAGVMWMSGALNDAPALAALCAGADAVIHIAGVVNGGAAAFDAGNRAGTLAMIGATENAGVSRFVHVSSLSAREPQLSLYGASKRAAEDAVVASALDWRIVRPPAIYGPGETEMLDMFKLARRGFVPLPPGGRASWVHATDMARLLVALVEGGPTRAFYEADDGHAGGWSHKEIAAMIGAAVGRRPLAIPLPKAMLAVAARADTMFRGDAAKLTPDRVGYLNHRDWTVSNALRPPADLWQPAIATAEGLKAMAGDYRARGLL